MKARKTSPLPTRVYKFALRPPTENAELVSETFRAARIYYNKLVTIENVRREQYRRERSRLFPKYAELENEIAALKASLEAARTALKSDKADARSRKVNPQGRSEVTKILGELKKSRASLKEMRSIVAASPELIASSKHINEQAHASIKALRPTLYWGTSQLCEINIQQASSQSKYEVAYDDTPAHLLKSRIGVRFIGSLAISELETDTQMQILDPPTFRQTGKHKIWRARYDHDPDGKKIHCRLRIRIASTEKHKPIWAEFPMAYDRPLPPDSRIMGAYVTRQPLRERNPWQYHLCIVLESKDFESTDPGPDQAGTTTINFGWRLLEDGRLRVATLHRDGQPPTFCELPTEFTSGLLHCRRLQSLLDQKFETVKKQLSAWISTNECPDAFKQCFEHLHLWKSQHKLNELVRYWQDHRFDGDADIWPVAATWMERYLHLHDWMANQRCRLMNWRNNFYRNTAKKIVTTASKIAIDTCDFSKLALRTIAEDEEKGGDIARYNRTVAAPSDLRLKIKQAAAKYHCEVLAAPTVNGTKRCNVCGSIEDVQTLEHECSVHGGIWDQDVNNTDNLQDAVANGEVVPIVTPAKTTENGDFQESETVSFGTARKVLGK